MEVEQLRNLDDTLEEVYVWGCLLNDAFGLLCVTATIVWLAINRFFLKRTDPMPWIIVIQLALLLAQTALFTARNIYQVTQEKYIVDRTYVAEWVFVCHNAACQCFMMQHALYCS